ncbi:MAG: aldehyde dehydrogenase family protein [Alphaproteobacteria bacterium]|nr:aldehyde dehydrogenase family protein [Alphaproteobacteria bacterium]
MDDGTPLPRVTYSNIGVDFSHLHDFLDREIPVQRARLGRFHPNRIGGRDDEIGEAYFTRSPIDRDLAIGSFVAADANAVERAVAAARKAAPGWSGREWASRVNALRAVAAAIERRKYELGIACLLEVGKSRAEAMGEVEETVDLIRYYAAEVERNGGYGIEMARAFPREATRVVLRAYGVFAVIAPFNFPLALSAGMSAGALLGGNTVVYKPSPKASLCGALLAECFEAADLPPGTFNLVCGTQAGPLLAAHDGIDGIAFTGSNDVGMQMLRRNAARPYMRPVLAEMGGKNPTFVTATADLDVASEGVMRSAFGLQGQKCSAGSVVYIERSVFEAFEKKLVERTGKLRIGDPADRNVYMGPLIDTVAADRYFTAVETVKRIGRVVFGGNRLSGGSYDRGIYVEPAIVAGLTADHHLNRDELFLPFLSLLPFDDFAEAIDRANKVPYGLTAGCYARDTKELDYFFDRAEAGVLYANRRSGATTGAWPGIQTFCGWKGSGMTGKGGLGPFYVPQFMREQSLTSMEG